MKAAVLEKRGAFAVSESRSRRATAGSSLGRGPPGSAAPSCAFLDGMLAPPSFPFILGHEAAGVVELASPRAPRGSAVGDRVAVYNFVGCGAATGAVPAARSSAPARTASSGSRSDGGFRDLIRGPGREPRPAARRVSFEDAALLSCSGMTAVARRADCRGLGRRRTPSSTVSVASGSMVIQVAVAAGARALASPTRRQRPTSREPPARPTASSWRAAPRTRPGRRALRHSPADAARTTTSSSSAPGDRCSPASASLGRAGTAVIIGYTGDDLVINPVELILSERGWSARSQRPGRTSRPPSRSPPPDRSRRR